MPSASLDCDEKYMKLLESYQDLCVSKNNDKNNNEHTSNKSSCKLFDNILESLIWLTENKDKNLLSQILSKNSQHTTASKANLSECIEEKKREKKTNVLITGSLYLVGLTLKVLNFKTD